MKSGKLTCATESSKVWIQSVPVVPFQGNRSKPRWQHSKRSGRRIVTLNEGLRTVARGDRRPPGNLGLYRQRQPGRSGQTRRGHLCSMRVAREKSASWPPTFGLDGRTRPVLAGAGAIHGDLPTRYGAPEDRPHSSGRPKRLGSTLSVPKRYPQLVQKVVPNNSQSDKRRPAHFYRSQDYRTP